MNADSAVKILEAIAKLVSALAWPCVALSFFLTFRSAITDFLADLGELTFKVGGVEVSGKTKKDKAAAALTAAAVTRAATDEVPTNPAEDAKQAVSLVSRIVTPRVIRQVNRASVLWADDKPDGNIHERQSLEALGVNFVLARSTEEALEYLKDQRFDAIISDLSRPGDPRAGFTLLDKVRGEGNRTPFFIYTAYTKPQYRIEAINRAATGFTNRPNELFSMVLSAIMD